MRDPGGRVVSGGVKLHTPTGVALDLVQGAIRDKLRYGANQLIYAYVLEDLAAPGAVALDYVGGNITAVAAAKAAWGLRLVPYLSIGSKESSVHGPVGPVLGPLDDPEGHAGGQ